jgi:hypothetical protein
MIIVRLLSPEPVGWIQHHQLYSGVGADIVMESITLTIQSMSAMAVLNSYGIASGWSVNSQIDEIYRLACADARGRDIRWSAKILVKPPNPPNSR